MTRAMITFAAVGVFSGVAAGQSFNIDFTRDGGKPGDGYAGVGSAGFWNSVDPPNFGGAVFLSDLAGNPTAVNVKNLGGSELLTFEGPVANPGDDRELMNDCLITRSATLESCIFFAGLVPGTYEVTMYAWMPDAPAVLSWATVDEAPGTGQLVGGPWGGLHELGVTYSTHTAEVLEDGMLRTHSGIAAGADASLGAALNGIQIRLLAACPADLNGDGTVGSGDLAMLLAAWGPVCPFGAPACPPDLDGDGGIGSSDLAIMLAAWGPCG